MAAFNAMDCPAIMKQGRDQIWQCIASMDDPACS